MKKIFTLLAVAAMALTASAQTWYIPYTMVQDPANPDKEIAETDFVIADGVTVAEDTDCPMTFGNDGAWKNDKRDQFKPADDPAYANYKRYAVGNGNPKCDGSGYKNDANTAMPTTGTYYTFAPKADGSLSVACKPGSGKLIRIVTSEGTFAPFTGVESESGTALAANTSVTNGLVGTNTYSILKFDVKSNVKYALLVDGSKLSLWGYYFTADGSSAITDITVDENAPVEYFNLQGIRVDNPENGLYIKRQGNNVTKVLVK